jgi:hypothetical protein
MPCKRKREREEERAGRTFPDAGCPASEAGSGAIVASIASTDYSVTAPLRPRLLTSSIWQQFPCRQLTSLPVARSCLTTVVTSPDQPRPSGSLRLISAAKLPCQSIYLSPGRLSHLPLILSLPCSLVVVHEPGLIASLILVASSSP